MWFSKKETGKYLNTMTSVVIKFSHYLAKTLVTFLSPEEAMYFNGLVSPETDQDFCLTFDWIYPYPSIFQCISMSEQSTLTIS